jgi:hypothetical protein
MKSQGPPQRIDQQIRIARVPDDTIDTTRDQRRPGLNGYQPAEPVPERKDWPDPQRTACSEENDAKLANGITIESADLLSVCIGRQISGQQPDQPEGTDDPAIATILAHTRSDFLH